MSLTTVIAQEHIRTMLNDHIVKPKISMKGLPCLVPLRPNNTSNATIIGTAADYLVRFRLSKEIGDLPDVNVYDCGWIAETAIHHLYDHPQYRGHYDKFARLLEKAQELINAYWRANPRETEVLMPRVIGLCQWLARVDVFYRVGYFDPEFKLQDSITQELKAINDIISLSGIKGQNCFLNPEFALASLVDGADADIVVDDTIIEIKTVSKPDLALDHIRQLVTYSAMTEIGGIKYGDNEIYQVPINNLMIFYPRFNHLIKMDINEVLKDKNQFLGDFQKHVLGVQRSHSPQPK